MSGFTQVPEQLTCDDEHEVVQVPAWQFWPPGHTRPQAPQLLLSPLRLISQPLGTSPSQSRKPAAQEATVHAPAAQPAVPLITVHARPQVPQWATVVLVLVSQPLLRLPSQLPSPELQAMEHTPPLHAGVPPLLGQRLPQLAGMPDTTGPPMPQLLTLLSVVVSQPLPSMPSQLPRPTPHTTIEMRHIPAVHTGLAPVGAEQRVPQAPQLEMSPIAVFTSQPLAGLPSQSAKPALQAPRMQRPAAQVAAALAKLQRLPQTPQFMASVEVVVSQPLVATLSQLPKPSRQLARVHALALHPATAPGRVHWLPQVRQLLGSVVRSRQVVPQST
ncbi:MAG: hypothetical protein IPN17_17860 [Deltaproteobacteria bacterium]|nr:hypothetical protein [Deltaproteobacteria bacterium]